MSKYIENILLRDKVRIDSLFVGRYEFHFNYKS